MSAWQITLSGLTCVTCNAITKLKLLLGRKKTNSLIYLSDMWIHFKLIRATIWPTNPRSCMDFAEENTACQWCGCHCTEVRFASFLSDGFTNITVINPPEKKLAKCTSVRCGGPADYSYFYATLLLKIWATITIQQKFKNFLSSLEFNESKTYPSTLWSTQHKEQASS